ncbi:hypothetical protein DFH08DRAFT_867332 [Mycena albidolilacea]|uniref:Uncharacterized protein n=1 Tax=Mycena albidolilacea TaxID=1033008 RepID=A0AAD7A269_9AGAR|nr:hypothetical protein DFH08DRAFT_867332 [Mycena albidolilacea]
MRGSGVKAQIPRRSSQRWRESTGGVRRGTEGRGEEGRRWPVLRREVRTGWWRGKDGASANEKTGLSVDKKEEWGGVDHEETEGAGVARGEIRRKGRGGVDGERVYERRKVTRNSHHQDPYIHPQRPRTRRGSGTQRTLRRAHSRVASRTGNGRGSMCP